MGPTLVTGSTGLLGNNVVRQLLARGERVRVLVRAGCDPRPLAGLQIETAIGDVRDLDSLRRAAVGVHTVIHSAAVVHIGWTGIDEARAINVAGSRNVAEAALAANARLVHVSSVDALGLGTPGQPADEETPHTPVVPCPYVLTKRSGEEAVLEVAARGLWAVIVNPGFMLGPWDWKPSSGRMLLQVARRWTPLAPKGVNNFCDARDVAAGVLAAAERGQSGRRYILGGESLTYLEAWRIFAAVAGARAPLGEPPGPLIMAAAGKLGDLWTKLTGREPDVNSASVAMARLPKYLSSVRAETELGYRPRSVREAAETAWAWFCEYGYAKARKARGQG
jgi:dihydroflavonol-4-reductase